MTNPVKQFNDIVLPNLDDSKKATFQQATSVVGSYDDVEFEDFILEWLKYCRHKISAQTLIGRIGGTGDNGIDIYENTNGVITYYQCKKYSNALTLPQMREIIIKVLWHVFKEQIDLPSALYIIAYKGINGKALTYLSDKQKLKESLIKNCKKDLQSIHVKEDPTNFILHLQSINNFDFIEKIDLDDIVKEYCLSDYSIFRFITTKDIRIKRVKVLKRNYDEDNYVQQLSKILKKRKSERIQYAKEQYYSALCLEETDKYLYGTNKEFIKLKREVTTNIETTRYNHFDDMDERYSSIIKSALETNADSVSLQYNLHMICADDKAGICHMMVNDNELSWEKEDE